MGQSPLAEHAQHAPQPRSIAWEGGGEAAMKGGAPWFLRESFWTSFFLYTCKKPRGVLDGRFIRLYTVFQVDSAWSQRPSQACWAVLPDDPP